MLSTISEASAQNSFPRDVQGFIERREGCDHMRGEVPDSSEKRRVKEIDHEIQKLCKGTDRAMAQLKKKYAANASIIARLNEFEDPIESLPTPASRIGTQR